LTGNPGNPGNPLADAPLVVLFEDGAFELGYVRMDVFVALAEAVKASRESDEYHQVLLALIGVVEGERERLASDTPTREA
jgi:hypothetical protein